MLIKRFGILLTIVIITISAFSQVEEKRSVNFYNLRVHHGSMIIHSRAIKDIGNANPSGVEVSFVNQSTTRDSWDDCNCYPRRGFSLAYWYFDKPEILGNGLFANAFIEPVFGGWNRWFFSIKAATGLAYLNKPYHPETNPYNFSYSTRFSFPLHLGVVANYRLNNSLGANFTFIYNHISNGGLREPNKGINWPTFALGLDYMPNAFKLSKQTPDRFIIDDDNRSGISVSLYTTAKQLNHSELKKYLIAGLTGEYSYRVSRLSNLTFGAEYEWDGSDREEVERDNSNADHQKGMMYAGHQFILGKFLFSQSLGVYFYAPYNPNDPLYQKYSLIYNFNSAIGVGIKLKAHRQVADFLALELRYSIR